MANNEPKKIDWEKEFKDKQKECEILVDQIEQLKQKPVLDVVVKALNEAMEKIQQVL